MTPDDRQFVLDHFRVDMSAGEIVEALSHRVTRNQVLGIGQRHSNLPKMKVYDRATQTSTLVSHKREPIPVPLVMAALAKFDPVIERACEARRNGFGRPVT